MLQSAKKKNNFFFKNYLLFLSLNIHRIEFGCDKFDSFGLSFSGIIFGVVIANGNCIIFFFSCLEK